MQNGDSTGVIKILTNNLQNGKLPLNREILSHLKLKHSEPKQTSAIVLLDDITVYSVIQKYIQ